MKQADLLRLAQRLPESPGLHRGDGSHHYVVFVPFVEISGEFHLLFEKRARGIRQEQEISFPGGKVEQGIDRSIEETALRETEEELGVPSDRIAVIGRLDAVITHWGELIDVVVGTIPAEVLHNSTPNADEVERLLLIPVSFFEGAPPQVYSLRVEIQPFYRDASGREHTLFPARELELPQRYWQPWAGPNHEVFAYRYAGETIWGITAGLTRRLVDLLG